MVFTYGGSLTIYSVTGHGQPTGSDLPTTGLVRRLRVLRHARLNIAQRHKGRAGYSNISKNIIKTDIT